MEVLHVRSAAMLGPDDGDHVEAGARFQQAVLFEVGQSYAGQLPLFGGIDRFGGVSGGAVLAGLDFNEHQAIAVAGDDVDLSEPVGILPGDDRVAQPLEKTGGPALGDGLILDDLDSNF